MQNVEPIQRRDFVLVGIYTAALYAIVLFVGGPLTMHEGVLSQTTRAMLDNHDWLVPRYGDAPWLERPPLPQWISCVICTVIGHCDQEWNVRIGSALAGLTTVLLTVWLSGRLFGRITGILSGLMLATMYNFVRYSTLAEADIYLSPIVAGALCAFAYAEILRTPVSGESNNFFGKRPWCVLVFFVLLGMTNLAKGLVFGTVITLAPVGVFLLWNLQWTRFFGLVAEFARSVAEFARSVAEFARSVAEFARSVAEFARIPVRAAVSSVDAGSSSNGTRRLEAAATAHAGAATGILANSATGSLADVLRPITRYLWLWGWLLIPAIALPWPLLALQYYPDAKDVWYFDLFGRLNSHYLEEPPWYYLECLTWVPQPWTIAAFLGLGLSAKRAFREGAMADRFIWCWAWAPLCVFSLSHGKHHHYMLHYLAPWAILSAQATVWIWARINERKQNRWTVPICIAVLGDAAIAVFARRLPGPTWFLPALLMVLPLFVFAGWWFSMQRRPVTAVVGCFALIFALYGLSFTYKGVYLHRSREDTAFLREVRQKVPLDQPLLINSADEALEGLRMQFYIGDTVYFLHNLSFVLDDRIHTPDVYVVTRGNRLKDLQKYGEAEPLLRCNESRRETSEADRWTLFHVHLREDVPRKKTSEYPISPMQAMYRVWGPYLDGR